MAADIEFRVDINLKMALRKELAQEKFVEKKHEITADINPELLSFFYSGVSSVFFSIIANIIYDKIKKSDAPDPAVEILIINDQGEQYITVTSKQQMKAIEFKTEGSFVSLKIVQ